MSMTGNAGVRRQTQPLSGRGGQRLWNYAKTAILLAVMTALALIVGQAIGGARGLLYAGAFVVVMNVASFWFSDRIALAINQAGLHDAERAAQERLQFLGEASALLASSLDVDETLERVVRLAVPHFADACAIVPTVNPDHITPHSEAFQAVVWHLLVSHPRLKAKQTKWESVK